MNSFSMLIRCASGVAASCGIVFHVLHAFMEWGVPLVNIGSTECTTAMCIMNHLQCFWSTFLDFTQDLFPVLCSSIFTVATHKKLVFKTCHNSTMANHRLAKLDHCVSERLILNTCSLNITQ
jgi:hypothetical protein